MAFCEVFEFTRAVRGFHVYRKFWIPEKGQLLNCFLETSNLFDPFAIKVCERNRITKFFIKRGGTVDVELTSDYYRRSPLVQGGQDIKCKVTVKVPNATPRQVTERYRVLIKDLYVEPKEEEILGSFIVVNDRENMDENFSIHQRSTRPSNIASRMNLLLNLKTLEHLFNKERNVHVCAERKIIVID